MRVLLWWWIEGGDGIRIEAGHDLDLIRCLRIALPPYAGPGMTLFRGEGARIRARRTYGVAWSGDMQVADDFAQGWWQSCIGGSVLLRADVPAGAIVAQVHSSPGDRFEEAEYLGDRRYPGRVTVMQRFE